MFIQHQLQHKAIIELKLIFLAINLTDTIYLQKYKNNWLFNYIKVEFNDILTVGGCRPD